MKTVDLLIKSKDFTVSYALFLGLICRALKDNSGYELIYFLLFLPIVNLGWVLFEGHRKDVMLKKIKRKELKMEIEHEYALYIMMTLVRDSLTDSSDSQRIFGQLMGLMLTHIEECDDPLCICDEMENFYELLRLRVSHNLEIFPLMRHER